MLTLERTEDPNTGFITYPNRSNETVVEQLSQKAKDYFDSQPDNIRLVEALLIDLCDWYNTERKIKHDPYELAAQLQRRFISIHPFLDVNGRLSRLLMDWSLENDGLDPAILFEPGDDILVSGTEWKNEVMAGSKLHFSFENRRKKLEAIGYENLAEMMGLSDIKTFYDAIFRQIGSVPEPPKDGEIMDHKVYKDFIEAFQKEYERFKEEFSKIRMSGHDGTHINYTQGGLIPASYIDFISLAPRDAYAYQKYLKKHFYTDVPIFRGGVATNDVNEQDIVRIFEQFIGAGTGYKALKEAHVSPISTDNVSVRAIARSLEFYNKLISDVYLGRHYPDKVDVVASSKLVGLVLAHITADSTKMFDSPFASTSLDQNISEGWSRNLSGIPDIKSVKTGLLFISSAPLFGGLLGFGDSNIYGYGSHITDIPGLSAINLAHPGEKELMVPGGIHPALIDRLVVNKKLDSGYMRYEQTYIAKKVQNGGGIFLIIRDIQRGQKTKYRLNPQTNQYEPYG